MNLSNKNVLITGISGFTGKHLAHSLTVQGAKVTGITNTLKHKNLYDTHTASLENFQELRDILVRTKPDYIIHLAGLSFAALENLLPYYNVNVLGTQNLLEACLAAKLSPKKIILASSAAVYGNPGHINVDEAEALSPLSHYGCSKLAMEFIAKTYDNRLPITITRPFNYTGVGQPEHFLVPKIVKHFHDKSPIIELGNIKVVREFGDVRDVVENYITLLDQDQCGIVNICSGQANSFESIVSTLEDITGHKIEIQINEKFIREKDIEYLVGNPKKLKNMTRLDYQYSLRDTLTAMVSNAG